MKINEKKLENFIAVCLDNFYKSRLEKIQEFNLKKLMKKKNPYLLRAANTQKVSEIVDNMIYGSIQASDETIFGEAFFEAIALEFSIGTVSTAEGVDIEIENKTQFTAYSVKSNANAHNSSAQKKQMDQFNTVKRRLRKIHKEFDPVLGAAYGKTVSAPTEKRHYRVVAGQKFWEEITNDEDFYLKIIILMKKIPQKHMKKYKPKLDKLVNVLNQEFRDEFCTKDGDIDWPLITKFLSEKKK